jgi:hypothetical protein
VALHDEKQILIDGHDYDGIQELDNRMPPWLQFLFYTTVVFALVYSAYYFSGIGDMQIAELDKEIATAEAEKKAEAEKLLQAAGFTVVESVTKTTNYLLDEENSGSSKRIKAEQYGILIITDLKDLLKENINE